MERPREGGSEPFAPAKPLTASQAWFGFVFRTINCTINVLLFSTIIHPGLPLFLYWAVVICEVGYVLLAQPLGRAGDLKVAYDPTDRICRSIQWRATEHSLWGLVFSTLHDLLRAGGIIWLFVGCVLAGLGC